MKQFQKKNVVSHHGESFFDASNVVADAPRRQRVGIAVKLGEDQTLRHRDEDDGDQREDGEGTDDVEGVLGGGVVALETIVSLAH